MILVSQVSPYSADIGWLKALVLTEINCACVDGQRIKIPEDLANASEALLVVGLV